MKPILHTVALLLFVSAAGIEPSEGLAARCVWAERGWRCEALSVDQHGKGPLAASALESLAEHRRLHGWGSLDDGGPSWMVSVPASCPPAALGEFARRELPVPTGDLVRVYRELALVLAKNRVTEGARRFLDAVMLPPGGAKLEGERALAVRDAARVLCAAKEWERALERLADFDPNVQNVVPGAGGFDSRAGSAASSLRETTALLRARCLIGLGRTQELEDLCAARITDGGSFEPSCRWIEILLEGWEDAGVPPRRESLIEALSTRFAGRPSLGARIIQLDALWEVALRHRRLLALGEPHVFPHVLDLLDAGDHRQDVLERIAAAGPQSLDALISLARDLRRDDPREHRLYGVLAATGDERVLPLLEERFPDREEITAELRFEAWEEAHALRRDLARGGR